ncbi:BatA domain-containing protein [Maribacter sp. SA7]|uniref:BatA domain-containing protein n=1 Tax=Maribacter zhoushanensis TaxID=3030012 RepID=UPI0023EAC844|nr:BatA domain-containing protein [Maribacter zhoushanensis]MDF4204362.1 BatA domain-containing protein [Maribacter zhoushanensis]
MSFAHPSYLWALFGLLVPIAIHLWSKKEAKTIKIGSVQLLSESKSKQSSSIQLNELWLLLLRMGIISLVVVLMAKPQWHAKISNSKVTYVVEPELAQNADFMSQFIEEGNDQEIRLLQKGLPLNEGEEQVTKLDAVQDYWALVSEMEELPTDSIVVFTNGFASGLKGARPESRQNINWIVIDSALSKETPLLAYKRENELQLYTGWSGAGETKVSSRKIALGEDFTLSSSGDSLVISKHDPVKKVPVIVQNPIEIALFYADSLQQDKRYIEASLKALAIYLDREINVTSKLDSEEISKNEADVVIWLSNKPQPEAAQKLLVLREDVMAQSIIVTAEEDAVYYLTKRITSENAVSERVTEKLLDVLEVNSELQELLIHVDKRSVAASEIQTNYVAVKSKEKQLASFNVNPYLWGLLLVLLLVERFVAHKRKQ